MELSYPVSLRRKIGFEVQNQSTIKICPYPDDGCLSGPLPSLKNIQKNESKYLVERRFSSEFPLKPLWPFWLPAQKKLNSEVSPTSIKYLNNIHSNCLVTFEVSNKAYLLYKRNSQLVISEDSSQIGLNFHKLNSLFEANPELPFIDIKIKVLNDREILLLLRSMKSVALQKIILKKHTTFQELASHSSSGVLADSIFNKEIDKYYYTISTSGSIELFDINSTVNMWKNKYNSSSSDAYFTIQNSSSPFNVLVSDGNSLKLFDIRQANKILTLPDILLCLCSEERIHQINPCIDTPYYYISCSRSILLMDERFCKTPVQTWQHMLLSPPKLSCNVQNQKNEFLFLSSPTDCSISMLCFDKRTCKTSNFASVIQPLTETLDYAHKNNIWFSTMLYNRLETLWSGFDVRKIDNSLYIYILNEYADIFLQKYVTNSVQDSNINNGLHKLHKWEQKLNSINKDIGCTKVNAFKYYKSILKASKTDTGDYKLKYLDAWNVRDAVKIYKKSSNFLDKIITDTYQVDEDDIVVPITDDRLSEVLPETVYDEVALASKDKNINKFSNEMWKEWDLFEDPKKRSYPFDIQNLNFAAGKYSS